MVIREERQDKGDRVSRWNACYNITCIILIPILLLYYSTYYYTTTSYTTVLLLLPLPYYSYSTDNDHTVL
jgi:hypothetical protein